MADFKKWMLIAAPIALAACGSSDLMVTEEGGIDTESDPSVAEEAALRTSPTFDAQFDAAAKEFNVPSALLKAIAYSQTRYEMVRGEVEFEGQGAHFGLMALAPEALSAGALAAGVSEEEARTDATANIRAAAAYLSAAATELGLDRSQFAAWAPAVEKYSGIENPEARAAYVRDEVLAAVRAGIGKQSDELVASGQPLTSGDLGTSEQELTAGPDYAPAIWRPSPNYSSRGSYTPKMIVIHTCEGSYSSCWSWLTNSASQVSAHYVVSTGSEVSQLVREANKAWHVGASYSCSLNGNVECGLNGVNVNYFSVGIEHAGFASQSSFPAAQLEASAKLSCDISKGRGIIRDRFHIVAHGKLQPATRTDPGPNWPWTSYLSRINTLCGTTPPPTSTSIIIDSNNARNNQAVGYIQVGSAWVSSSATAGYYGTGYYYAPTTPGGDGATFYFKLGANGTKTIDGWWTAGTNRSSAVSYVAFNAQGVKVGAGVMNQQVNGGAWRQVGSFPFTAGWNKVVISRWAAEGSVVIADALRVR